MNNVLISNILFITLPILIIGYFCFIKLKGEKLKKQKLHQIFCLSFFIMSAVIITAIKITNFDTPSGEVKDYKTELGFFTGVLENGVMTGNGTLILDDKTVIKASFHDNKATGYGTIEYTDNTIYEGQISDGKMNGEGVYVVEKDGEKTIYKGNFTDSFLTGFGTINYPNGAVYEGYCVNFIPNTLSQTNTTAISQKEMLAKGFYGQMTFTDGSIYIGEIKNGKFYGNGSFKCGTCGHFYEGLFKNNLMNGIGKLTKSDGQLSNGNWINDTFNNKLFSCDNPFYSFNKQLNGGVNEESQSFKNDTAITSSQNAKKQ